MKTIVGLAVLMFAVGCGKTTLATHSAKQYPITHGFSNRNPENGEWEITDPKFALWVASHCYAVKPDPMAPHVLEGREVYGIQCDTDKHENVDGMR